MKKINQLWILDIKIIELLWLEELWNMEFLIITKLIKTQLCYMIQEKENNS